MTIYDIAKEAGVSASTVSRVVNKKSGVHPATKKKIEHLLEKYNYSPNETARGLVMQNNHMIGILIEDIRNVSYTGGAYAIEREFARLGYCCIILNTGTSAQAMAEYVRIMSQRRVDGLILVGSTFQIPEVEEAISQYFPSTPVIMTNGYLDLPNVHGVLVDERAGVEDMVKLLYARGHKNLVFVTGADTPSGRLKEKGFEDGVVGHGKAPLVIYQAEPTWEGGYEATERLMRERPETDGIIYCIDLVAAGGGRALMDMGFQVPEKVAYTGIDNCLYAELSTPRITSLDNKRQELSVMGARLLIDILEGRQAVKKMMLFPTIVERETTRKEV